LLVRTDGSDKVSCGAVDEATCRAQDGVEVPIPRRVLLPPLTKMALVKEPVEVANFELACALEAQAEPVPPNKPEVIVRQPSAIPRTVSEPVVPEVAKRLVDEAVVAKKLVEVAEEDVELTAVKFWRVVEPTTVSAPSVPMVEVAVRPTLRDPEVRIVLQRLVEEAAVEVDLVMLLKMCAPVQVGEKD
jgi:hypothetical protein